MRKGLAAILLSALAVPAGGFDWYVGDGSDGVLYLNSPRTEDTVKTNITALSAVNDQHLNVAAGGPFSAGDLVLVIQMSGVGAGLYEFNRVTATAPTDLYLSRGLGNVYQPVGAQVLKVAEYSHVTVSAGALWSAGNWDGATGGVLAAVVRGSFTLTGGAVNMGGRGFAGVTTDPVGSNGAAGDGPGAGGGGQGNNPSNGSAAGGGGGGGYGAPGVAGTNGGWSGGGGGSAYGTASLSALQMGSSGGQGTRNGTAGFTVGNGGNGGGTILFAVGGDLSVSGGFIRADGMNGGDASGNALFSSGGGGAGGAIRLVSTGTVQLGGAIQAAGGNGGTFGTPGGAGAAGRIALLQVSTPTGITAPLYDASSPDGITQNDIYSLPPLNVQVTAVSSTAVSLSWNLAYPAAQYPVVLVSTRSDFSVLVDSRTGTLGQLTTTYTVPFDNTTYYFKAKAAGDPDTNYSSVVSTMAEAALPSALVFDHISTHSITAAAYAPGTAFSGMTAGLSGVNVASGAVYAGWRGESWSSMSSMTFSRHGVAVAVAGGKLYAIGGHNGLFRPENEEYDPVSNSWLGRANMNSARFAAAAGAIDGKVYVVGGNDGANTTINEVYDPAANAWMYKAPMTVPRQALAAVAVGGRLYAIGGQDGGYKAAVEAYDPVTDSWVGRTAMNTPRAYLTAAAVGGKIYVLGGYDGTPLTANEAYDTGLDGWTTKASLPTRRQGLVCGAIGGKVYALTGSDAAGLSTNEVYDPGADTWSVRSPIPTARYGAGSAVLSGRIHVVGGSNGGYYTANEAFDPGVASSFTALVPNTLYTFKAKARNQLGVETAEVFASTYTLAVATGPVNFSGAFLSSITLSWSDGGGGPGASYLVQASTMSTFLPVAGSSFTKNPFAAVEGLAFPNATHYFRIQVYNTIGQTDFSWFNAGSTATAIEAPTGIIFDEIATTAITASAYAAGPAFSSMTLGLSGTNIALGGSYSGWHGEGWTSPMPMNISRTNLAGAALGGRFHAIGGNGPIDIHEEYDPATNAWNFRAAMLTPRSALAAAAAGGRIYAIDGTNGSNLSLTEEYDPEADQWRTRSSFGIPRSFLAAAVMDGKVYAAGGAAGTYLSVLARYDPDSDSWTSLRAMNFSRQGLGLASSAGRLYALGGDNAGGYRDLNEEYDAVVDTWTLRAGMPTPRTGLGAAALGGKVYSIGGQNAGGNQATVEAYDPAVFAWSTGAAMPSGRTNLALAALGGRVYAVGGFNGGPLTTNEAYDPGIASSFTALTPNTLYTFKAKARNQTGVETAEVFASTYTLAVATGPVNFTEAFLSSITLTWSDGGGGPGASFLVQASTMSTFLPVTGSSFTKNLFAAVEGLAFPNATHYFRAQAYNSIGQTDFGWFVLGSTPTLAAEPGSASSTFTSVGVAAFSVRWSTNGNPVDRTTYTVVLTTGANYPNAFFGNVTLTTAPAGPEPAGTAFAAFLPNTTYYLFVAARNAAGLDSAYAALGATCTRANPPSAAFSPNDFPLVYETSATVRWLPAGNPVDITTYTVAFSTGLGWPNSFSGNRQFSTAPAGSDTVATVTGLMANTIYHARVWALNHAGAETSYVFSGTTVTTVETPTSIYFDEVTASTIVASAYAPGAAFSSMTVGLSGTNVALDGSYQGWHGESWSVRATMSAQRNFVAVAALGGRVYAVGGQNLGGFLATTEAYDPVTNGWTPRASISGLRARMAAAALGGKLYVLGGYNGGVFPTNEVYDPEANEWTVKAPMPAARHDFSAVAYGGKLYGFGGTVGAGYMDRNEVYDPATDAWTVLTPMPTARQSMVAGVINGKIYVVGGHNGSVIATNEAFDPANNTWTPLLSTPTARAAASGGALGGKLYFLAGENTPPLSANEVYDPVLDVWETRGPVLAPRNYMGTAVTGGRFYLVGGAIGAADSDAIVEYDPGVASSFTALSPNKEYFFKAKARNSIGVETPESMVVSTYTLAAATVPQSGPIYTEFFASSITVNWSSRTADGRLTGPGASFLVEASTMNTFIPLAGSSLTKNSVATVSGLFANSTHYFRVRAFNINGAPNDWAPLGSTMTAIEAPVDIYFDDISSHSIVASAYVPTPAFSSMTVGLSGTNVAIDGLYQGWHGEKWTSKPGKPVGRGALPASFAIVDGLAYVLGGDVNGTPFTDNHVFNPMTDQWVNKNALPSARNFVGQVGFSGRVYAMGGDNSTVRDTVFRYDPASDAWDTLPTMPVARSQAGFARLGEFIYMIGGHAGAGSTNTTYRFEPLAEAWTQRTGISESVYHPVVLNLRGRLHAIGGSTAGSAATATGTVSRYDENADSWETRTPMPTARWYAGGAVVGGKAYVLGGNYPAACAGNKVEEYDPLTDSWTSRTNMPTGRQSVVAGAIGGRIYAVAGYNCSFSWLTATEEFDPGVAASITGLTPNTLYTFKAKARNSSGSETAESPSVSTYTLAAATVPQSGGQVFTILGSTEATVVWSSGTDSGGYNGAGASYRLEASTMGTFAPTMASSVTLNWFAQLGGLEPNATHYFRVRAYNTYGAPNDWFSLGSTVTRANPPTAAVSTFTMLGQSSMTVAWEANGNSLGTTYRVVFSTYLPYQNATVVVTTTPYGPLSATVAGLLANSTYYPVIAAINRVGVASAELQAGSTVTMIESPTTVYIDEVTTHSLTAAAYVVTAFSSMTAGLSGTNIYSSSLLDYGGWRKEGWTTLFPAPGMNPRNQVGGAVLGGKFYALGGSFVAATGDTQEYDPASNSWAQRAAMRPRNAPATAVYGGRIFAVGGYDAGALVANQSFDPESNTWTWLSSMPVAGRDGAAAAAAAGEIFVIGGNAGAGDLDTVQSYDPAADTWTARTGMPTARTGVRAAELGGKIYALGGSGLSSANEVYDPGTGLWASRAPMTSSRSFVAVVRLGGKLVAAGGYLASLESTATEEYDPVSDTWTARSAMPLARANAAAGVLGGRLFLAGGWNNSLGSLSQTDVFDPGTTRKFSGLLPNTAYTFRAKARNSVGAETGESVDVSTYTLAVATMPGGAVFGAVYETSVTVNWSGGANGPGASFLVQASSMANFLPAASSMTTGALSATLAGLSRNATHYFRIRAYNTGGMTDYSWFILGSTVTAIETPTGVYFDEISSSAITASAYAPNPAFSSMTVGLSGTNVAKGTAYKGWHGEAWTTGLWPMPTARDGGAFAAVGGYIYIIAGNTGVAQKVNERYDPVANGWSGRADLPDVRYGSPGAAVVGGRIYVIGGRNSLANPEATNFEYDPEANQWAGRAPMPTSRSHAGVAAVDGKIYVVGGQTAGRTAVNEVYDVETDTWTARAPMSGARDALRAVAVYGKVYAFGGNDGVSAQVRNEEYSPAADAWVTKASMTVARWDFGAALLGGKIYAISGNDPGLVSATEAYDPLADTWTVRSPVPTPRATAMTAQVGGRLYAIGGNNGPMLNSNESFDAGVGAAFTGLTPNTQYFFKAKARNSIGVETGETVDVSTYTLAVATTPPGPVFSAVYETSVTVNWSDGGGGAGASFRVQASSMATFRPLTAATTTGALSATLTGLFANATHYFRIQAYNAIGQTDFAWFNAGSTATAIETPTGIYFDEISSSAITASAYAPNPAFSSMTVGLSGTNIARGVSYAGWHGEGWSAPGDFSSVRYAMAAAAVGGKVYVLGGRDPGYRDLNEEFDPVANTWAFKAVMPTPRAYLGAAVIGGRIYAVGGTVAYFVSALDSNEEYDPVGNSWRPRAPLPTARYELAVAALGGRLYAVGGKNPGTTPFNEEYDADADTWTPRAPLSSNRARAAAAALDGKVYLVGGEVNGGGGQLTSLDVYDPALGAWSGKAPMPTARKQLAAAVVGGRLYALGGQTESAAYFASNEEYDPGSDSWKTRTPMPAARSVLAAAAAGGRVYALGGSDGGLQKSNFVWDPGVGAAFTGLTPNTQYFFKAKARNSVGVETGETVDVSTYTLAVATMPGGAVFSAVYETSVTVNWSDGGGGAGASFLVQASSMASFLPAASSMTTGALSATLQGLARNATHYFRVRAYNTGGMTDYSWFVPGSTVTAVETPTAVYFDEISSTAITASAYAPGAAFSSMTVGLSGTNVSLGGGYAGWKTEGWRSRAAVQTARGWNAAAALGGKIYVMGGWSGTELKTTEVYDPVTNLWANGPDMLTGRYRLSAVTVGDRLYAVGGGQTVAGTPVDANEEFDPEGGAWTAKAPLPSPRATHVGAAVDGVVYIIGGNSNKNEAYDPRTDSWATKAVLSGARDYMAAAVVGRKIHVFGGTTAPLATHEDYDTAGDSWSVRAGLPTARYGAAAGVVGGKIFVFGGHPGPLAVNEAYDPATGSWTVRSPMPSADGYLSAPALGGRLYLIGGGSNQEFDAGVASSFTALTPNTEYFFKAKARNSVGVETGETLPFSTYTHAAVPGMHANPFPEVFISSVGVQWLANNNPVGPTKYRLHASTASDFNLAASSAVADWDAVLSTYAVGLAGNTTYYFRVQARNVHEVQTSYLVVGQAATTPFPPASAVSTFSAVFGTTLDLSWGANGNGPGTLYEAVVSTQPLPNGLTNVSVTTRPAGALSATMSPLISNATYYAAVRAISHSGAPTAFVALGSTVTRVNPPVTAASTFSAVAPTSFTAAWGGNGNNVGTRYEAVASTAAALDLADPANIPVSTDPYGAEGADFSGLGANTTYYLFVAAKARTGELTPYIALGSTVTPAAAPAAALSTYSAVESSSMTVSWSANANALGTRYLAVVSTQTPLSVGLPGNRTVSTDAWGAPSADITGLLDNTTYYLFVSAIGRGGTGTGFTALGSTVTDAATPSSVYFDAVSSYSIVAVASGPVGGFTNLGISSSAVNIASAGVFQGWVSGSSVAVFSGLVPNSSYTFTAKARNQAGTETPASVAVATYTLAAVPSTATPSFANIWQSSVAFQWEANGNPAGTEFEASASTDQNFGNGAAVIVSTWQISLSTAFSGLAVNATYYFQVRARNFYAEPTAYRQLGSTVTGAAVPMGPSGAASTFTAVGSTYMTVNWDGNGNPSGTQYLARLSTASSFGGGAQVVEYAWTSLSSETFVNLSTDTVYYAAVRARNHALVESGFHFLGSTATPVAIPAASTAPFYSVGVTSVTVQWTANGNPSSTLYEAITATSTSFSGWSWSSGFGAMLSTTTAGLYGDATYYWRVRAKGVSGAVTDVLHLGSTATLAAPPAAPALRSVGPSSVLLDWGSGGNREAESLSTWSFAQQLAQGRERHGAAWVNGRVYVAGGIVGGVPSSEVWSASAAVDGTLGAWRAEASLPAARESHALAAFAGRLYVVGGFDGVPKKTVYWAPVGADGALGAWSQGSDLPAARYKLAAAAEGGWLYALGGDDGIVSQTAVYAAPIAADGTVGTWALAGNLPAARNSHGAAAAGGRVFVVGGLGAGVEGSVWSASLSGPGIGLWTTGADLAVPVFRHALLATPGALLAVGGHDGNAGVATVQAAPVDAAGAVGAWSARTPLAQARFGHAAVLEGRALLALGGSDGAAALSSVELAAPAGAEYLAERARDGGFSSDYASSSWRGGAAAELGGLTPNTTYFFQVRSRSRTGAVGQPVSAGSTITVAAVPVSAASTFTLVEAGSITVNWAGGGNPAGTEFLTALATATTLFSSVPSSGWTTSLSSAVFGLSPNTTYYALAVARNSISAVTPAVFLGSTLTLAAVPTGVAFEAVQAAGFRVTWSTAGNPAGTLYEAQASTAAAFATLDSSTVTTSSSAVFSGLLGAATYYLRVRALNWAGTASAFSLAASTATGQDLAAPGAAADLTANATETPGTMLAAWTVSGDDGAAGVLTPGSRFYVQWAASPAAAVSWSTANAQVSASTGPAQPGAGAGLLVTGLPVGSWVSMRVWTLDEVGNVSALSNAAYAWVSPFALSTLDGAGTDAGRGASLALDRTGNAHAAYTAGTATQELRYMTSSGGVWSVAEAPDPGTPAADPVIAQGAGVPQIVYRNPQTGQLRASRRAGAWSASVVASGNLVPGGLGVDATDYAHVTYYDAAAGDLRYARFDGAAWQTEAVDTAGDVGRFSSLALDAAARPAVAYYDSSNARLKFSTRSAAGAWSGSVVDSGVDVGSSPVVALDADGRATVAYIDSGAKLLKVASWSGTAWTGQTVDAFVGTASVGALVFDGAGRPQVSYHDGAAADLRVARWTGTGWSTGTVASLGAAGEDSDLAVGAGGELTLVYYDASAGDLKAASWAAGLAVPTGGGPRGRLGAPAAFSGVVASSITVQWLWTDSVADELGWRIYGGLSSTGPFSLVASTSALPGTAGTGTQLVYNETPLVTGTTYYRYAVAVTSSGAVFSPMGLARPVDTTDSTPPTIVRNQSGDTVWRKAGGAVYDIDFVDPGGSGLAAFLVKASTRSGGVGPDLIAFTTVAAGALGEAYSTDWALPAAVFTALLEGATNWITVRAVDGLGNAAELSDAFYVLKDTTPPALGGTQSGDLALRASSGTRYDIDATDTGGGLAGFQYSVSTTALAGDAALVGWNDIPLTAGTTRYASDWELPFSSLLGGSTNFVSVRAFDRAGGTTTAVDAFFVLKDTAGPQVAVSTPSAAFPSALGTLSGSAADSAGLAGVEVAIQSGGLWWNGAIWASVTQTWLAASGTAAWTYSSVPAWADGTAYRVVARASDSVGNYSAVYSTADFTLDASSPAVSVTVPAPEAALSSLASLSGTAADAGAGLAWIRVSLRRASDAASWDWNASSWSVAAVSTTPALAASWSLPLGEGLRSSLADGASYFVTAWAADSAVPANTGGLAVGATAFHWADSLPPSAVTDLTALSGSAPSSIALSWTAPGDDGGAGTVSVGEFRVHFSSVEPVAFSTGAAGAVLSTSAVVPGSRHGAVLTGLEAGATYFLRVFFSDDSGNWSALSNGATAMATPEPFNQIWGHVVKTSSEGITGVLVEAYDAAGTLVSSTNTVNDSSGTFKLRDIPTGAFKVQATWTAGDITSSVWLDGIAQGAVNVDFILQINYTLSTLTGTIGSQAAQAASPAGFLARAAEDGFRQSRVELLRNGRPIVETTPDPTGRWTISNLLPGRYAVRAFNGLEYTEPQDVELGEGETREVVLVFDPLPEAQVFAFPNPARERTIIRFVSGLPGLEAQVSIFDIAGVLVKEIPGSAMAAKPGGLTHAAWDLTNDRGEGVASGVYLFMVKVRGSNGQSGKVIKKLAVVR